MHLKVFDFIELVKRKKGGKSVVYIYKRGIIQSTYYL